MSLHSSPLIGGSIVALAMFAACELPAQHFQMEKAPPIPTLEEGGFAREPSFFDDFGPDWESTQTDWRVATWLQNGTQMSPERSKTDGQGHMVQTVLAGEPYLGGSMQTDREFPYGRWIARVKPSNVKGVLNSIFTVDWDDLTTPESDSDGNRAEVDIEFLTYLLGNGQGSVHLAIHLNNGRSNYFVRDPSLDFDPSEDFHEWGFDILPDRVVWHVDGKFIEEWLYTAEAYIDENYEFFFNSWSQRNWINGPAEEDAHYMIDWVKFYPLLDLYAEWEKDAYGNVDTGDWLGFINVEYAPWVWLWNHEKWLYMPEDYITDNGSWGYFRR